MRRIVEDAAAVAEHAAAWIAGAIRAAVAERGHCTVALSGGSTPRVIYPELARRPGIPWPQVEIFFGDERAVPPDSPDSNFGMTRVSLLELLPTPPGQIHRMEVERDDLATIAREYEALLPASLDVLLLGIGADGHIASLFPHAPALLEQDRLVMPVVGGEPLIQRLTITPPVIRSARRMLVCATGAAKAEAVARALEGPDDPREVPAQLAREGDWILDRAAAGRLAGAG